MGAIELWQHLGTWCWWTWVHTPCDPT